MLLIWLLWQIEIIVGLVLLGFQVGVVGSLDFYNFHLEPHSNIL
jgi:hypothetical protein